MHVCWHYYIKFDKKLIELANIYLLKVKKVTLGQGVKGVQGFLKLVSAIFYKYFIFSPNVSP